MVDDLLSDVVTKAREDFGEATYKYYAIPVSWMGRKRGHFRPLMYLEQYETTKEIWEQNKEESRKHRSKAFCGDYNRSYTDYEKRRVADGWKEKLIALINNFES